MARLVELARQDRRAEAILYPVLCAGSLFGIGTHFVSAIPAAHEIQLAFQECLRLVGLG